MHAYQDYMPLALRVKLFNLERIIHSIVSGTKHTIEMYRKMNYKRYRINKLISLLFVTTLRLVLKNQSYFSYLYVIMISSRMSV